eukprot:887845-Pleurochrysis_carterae.AAC.1
MHNFLFCTRVACVLAERSRSAPQGLGSRSAHGRNSLTAPPPELEPPRRPAQPPRPRLLLDLARKLHCNIMSVSRLARTVTLRLILVKIQLSLYTPAQACVIL